jgi:lipopolysaccharide export LptBFGC system permease protein LptF
MARFLDPVIADLQMEHALAIREGRPWRSRWTLFVGHVAFAKVALLCGLLGTRQAWRNWNTDDQRGLNRTLLYVAAVTLVSTIALEMPNMLWLLPDMLSFNAEARLGLLILYLLPSALALSLPAGLAIGAALGVSQRARSRRVVAAVGLVALLTSMASLVNVGWVTPVANQSFREEIIGGTPARGDNELTLTEMRSSVRTAFAYHSGLAIAAAPLTFAVFAVLTATRRWRRVVAVVVACVAVVSFVFALRIGSVLTKQGAMPPQLAAWMPQILLAYATILISRVPGGDGASVTQTRA